MKHAAVKTSAKRTADKLVKRTAAAVVGVLAASALALGSLFSTPGELTASAAAFSEVQTYAVYAS